jgi:hypothetical protein
VRPSALGFAGHGEEKPHVARTAERAPETAFEAREREGSASGPDQRLHVELGIVDALPYRLHAVALSMRAPGGDTPAVGKRFAGSPNTLFFTDGINGEANGLFGALTGC